MVFVAALVMGALGFLCFQFMIKNTEIRVDTETKVSEDQPKFNVIKAMGNFVKNRPAVGATLAAMGMFIGMQGANLAVSVTFQIYFKNPQISGLVSMFAMIPIVVFTPLARKMVTKYGKKELSLIGSFCYVIGAAVLFLAPLGILPVAENNTGLDLVMYIVAQLIMSLGLGIYSTVSWAMMGDAIDYNEWKTGNREEGTVYSLHSFFRKLAQGLGPSIVLVVMAWLGYNEYMGGNQTFLVSLNLRYLVAALYLISALFQFIGLALVYNLDKKTLEQMNKELGEKHGKVIVEGDDLLDKGGLQ
jgi:GPH family glycoside/pentoside/hexuronide:cation symporter